MVAGKRLRGGLVNTGRTPSMDFGLLFEEGEERGAAAGGSPLQPKPGGQAALRSVLRLSEPVDDFERQLSEHVAGALDELKRGRGLEASELAEGVADHLRRRGCTVRLGSSRGGNGPAALRNLKHTCVWAVAPGGGRVLVDPSFRAQFLIGRPTPTYEAVLAEVPEAFVGRFTRLERLVNVLCEHMSASFQDAGLSLPPWRNVRSLLSKWDLEAVGDMDGASSAHKHWKASTSYSPPQPVPPAAAPVPAVTKPRTMPHTLAKQETKHEVVSAAPLDAAPLAIHMISPTQIAQPVAKRPVSALDGHLTRALANIAGVTTAAPEHLHEDEPAERTQRTQRTMGERVRGGCAFADLDLLRAGPGATRVAV